MKPHNPDSLTPEQVGISDGYRLLDKDEIKVRSRLTKHIDSWQVDGWENKYLGSNVIRTYRTRLSREELAKLK